MLLTITAMAGVAAALLMFCGDMLLYFCTKDYKSDKTFIPYVNIMKELPDWRLKAGGMLGPIAAFFYCIGFLSIFFITQVKYQPAAVLAVLLSALGIIIGGAYHSHFTYFGLLGKTNNLNWLDSVSKNVRLLSSLSFSLIAIGMAILAVLILLGGTIYPRWFVVFTPAVTCFLILVWNRLPQPFRIVLSGGWYNLMFFILFAALLLMA